MTFTVTITDLSIFLIAITFFILVIYLIPTIIQLRQTARSQQELSELTKKRLNDLEEIMNGVGRLKVPIETLVSLIAGIRAGFSRLRKEGKEDVRK